MLLSLLLGLAVGLPLGYALSRGGFCVNTAFRSILFERERSTLRAYVLVLAINLVAVNLLDELRVITITRPPFAWLASSIGGFVFGAGMVLGGGCMSGSCYRAGRGALGSLAALAGFALGASAVTVGALAPLRAALSRQVWDIQGEEATLANLIAPGAGWVRWAVIGVLVVAAALWLSRSPRSRFTVGWDWRVTGAVVGLLATLAWVASGFTGRDYGLSFTQPIVSIVSYITAGDDSGIGWPTFVLLGVPVGSLLAAARGKELGLKLPSPSRLVGQAAGGILMGMGAGVAGGCNIGHGITGVSTLALSSIVATLATMLGVWSMTAIVYARERARPVASAATARG